MEGDDGSLTAKNQQYRTGITRSRRIFVRVSDQEFDEIRSAAETRGISVSRYLIESCEVAANLESVRRKYETEPVVKELEAIRTEIWHIGHNINQIARNTNREMAADERDEYSAVIAVRNCALLLAEVREIINGFRWTDTK
ncbi:plasmid mobilization relaxosome protein MobC [Bifidobacterium adolescentis]|nr:plasmid mobilization relaxosome protein MobC [Bifidobacterium adolescentis]NRD15905.1 plasmid mobilization relaxosome protein MobC [Bifidobacterium adolescentis]